MRLTKEQEDEINSSRLQATETYRPTVAAIENVLYNPFPVLNHGFIRVVDYMGDDSSIVQAARVSYGRGTKRQSDDQALIMYLLRHAHTTPFEMAEIKFHVKLPIFVARQWIRHRTASVNEYSARYSLLDKEFYIPEPNHLAVQSASNRQGRAEIIDRRDAERVLHILREDSERNYSNYEWMVNEDPSGKPVDQDRKGIARELARINLTLNTYTQWYWKVDLHNLMGFLRLRIDQHAQYEIRIYAERILELLKLWVPLTHEAFLEHKINAVTLSRSAIAAVRRMVKGEKLTADSCGLSAREWRELSQLLDE